MFRRALLTIALYITLASPARALDVGTDVVNDSISLGGIALVPAAIRVLDIFALFLSAGAVLIILYAGILWATARDNAEVISKAKKTLVSGSIGLFIILSSWSTTYFIARKAAEVTGVAVRDSSHADTRAGNVKLPCLPNCGPDSCGDDGCGGTCGDCKVVERNRQRKADIATIETALQAMYDENGYYFIKKYNDFSWGWSNNCATITKQPGDENRKHPVYGNGFPCPSTTSDCLAVDDYPGSDACSSPRIYLKNIPLNNYLVGEWKDGLRPYKIFTVNDFNKAGDDYLRVTYGLEGRPKISDHFVNGQVSNCKLELLRNPKDGTYTHECF